MILEIRALTYWKLVYKFNIIWNVLSFLLAISPY